MSESKECFRCGKEIKDWSHGGKLVLSGFEDCYSGAYFDSFVLCSACNHEAHSRVITYLYEGVDENEKTKD